MTMTSSQQKALNKLRAMFPDSGDPASSIYCTYKLEVTETDYGLVWIAIDQTYPNSPGTMLSALADRWHMAIGKRGKIEAYSYPKSVEQFRGSTYLGVYIRKSI